LGKHSSIVFTNNTNTEGSTEQNLLDEHQCLTGELLQSTALVTKTYLPPGVTMQSEIGKMQASLSKKSLDLLEQFEMTVRAHYLLSLLSQ